MTSHSATQLDRHAYRESLIHQLDPRAKILATFFFIAVVASFPKYAVGALVAFLLYPLALIILGEVPVGLILKRLLWISPFVLFVGIFNPLLDREPAGQIGGIAISAGWLSFASIALRFLLTVGAALALIATTPFPIICQALGRLGVPRVMVTQLLFLYRYLFVLIEETSRMLRARELRSAGGKQGRSVHTATTMLAVLFTRTIDRAERVYKAMLLRGFQGDVLTLTHVQWRLADTLFLLIVVVFSLGLRIFPLSHLLERIG